jgi:hypothetical protein
MLTLGLFLGFLGHPIWASTQIQSQIFDIDYGRSDQELNLILLSNGQVLKASRDKSQMLKEIASKNIKEQLYEFTINDQRFVLEIKSIETSPSVLSYSQKMIDLFEPYLPTTISSLDVARRYFREARYNPKESQCFNRAMVWTYEWWRKHSLKSNKILIFFTRNYIRRYSFEWWFHISPYVHVLADGKVVEKVMDVKYGSGPMSFRSWTNLFMKGDPECPVITKFSDYADNPYIGDCYIIRTNMYTYQPADLQMNEAWGYTKDHFEMKEVKQAYLEAFNEILLETKEK